MFVLSVRRVECQQVKSGRRGAVVPWLILLFPVLLGCFSLAVHIASLYQRQLELQIASDAAALAGVSALSPLDDLLLFLGRFFGLLLFGGRFTQHRAAAG